MSEIHNTVDGNNGRSVVAEEKIGKLEDIVIETKQNETQREKIL